MPLDTARCWSNHLGLWSVEPLWFTQAVALFRQGAWLPPQAPVVIEAAEQRAYDLTKQGTAVIPLMGPLSKGGSLKFGGNSTVMTQRAIRLAAADEDVATILLHVDSPGGHVAGIEALASEVASVRGRKPIVAHIDDLGASAAYWVASQADAVYANATSEVGSIGTIAVIEDTSGRMDRLGIKVHVISTGPYKGAAVDGAPISEATLAYLQDRVAAINQHFLGAVQSGRRMTSEGLAAVADGRVHIAAQAQQLGLVDRVQSLDATLAQLSTPARTMDGRVRATRAAERIAAWQAHH